jgi:hypothetical protein
MPFYSVLRAAIVSQLSFAGAGITDGRGLFFGGGVELVFIQLLALVVCSIWSACLTWVLVEGMQRAGVQLRPPEGYQEHGIDFVSHGERYYTCSPSNGLLRCFFPTNPPHVLNLCLFSAFVVMDQSNMRLNSELNVSLRVFTFLRVFLWSLFGRELLSF